MGAKFQYELNGGMTRAASLSGMAEPEMTTKVACNAEDYDHPNAWKTEKNTTITPTVARITRTPSNPY